MRAFWWLGHGVPFHKPNRILYAYYPNLKQVDTERPAHDDAFYDIVFLGGSVLHRDWTPIERILREQLADNGHRNVRIFNLAVPAHTSRDSWLKYASFRDVRFELVVFYHGVNETRANNAPPQLFREDYAHYSWYKSVNMLAAYHGTAVFCLALHPAVSRHWSTIRRDPASLCPDPQTPPKLDGLWTRLPKCGVFQTQLGRPTGSRRTAR